MVPGKYTQRAKIILNYAKDEVKRLKHDRVDTEHILLGLVHEGQGVAAKALQNLGIPLERIEMEVRKLMRKAHALSDDPGRPPSFSPAAQRVMQYAADEAQRLEYDRVVGTEHILLGLVQEKNGMAARALANMEITLDKVRRVLEHISPPQGARKPQRAIDQYSRDLTALAAENMLDPIIGRDDEMDRVMQILIRRKKNNPVLIGEPGVGKTAIAEGLAQRIISRDVPEPLLGKRLLALDLAGLVAGTKYRGQFEERLKNIMNEIRQSQNIVLFIDEIHTLVGTGAAEGAIDAANMLKPALSRGEIQCIGATTLDEYRKYIEKDGALERRFQIVNVLQPSVEETIEILKGLKVKYEEHHNVIYVPEALVEAAKLSARYISDRYLPDKAIDVIDEAGSWVRMQTAKAPKLHDESPSIARGKFQTEISKRMLDERTLEQQELRRESSDSENSIRRYHRLTRDDVWNTRGIHAPPIPERAPAIEISEDDIAQVVAKWTGIPISKLEETESAKLLRMEGALQEHVIGQDNAIVALARAVRRSRAGLKEPTRPIGSFIFIGPTGVGKSYLADVLARFLFGDEDAIIRIDMSEFMEKFSVSRLIGAPPGYVGYQEGGELTEKVRRRPYSVILLDEIEKAHPDVFNILLQVLDNGRLTDNLGHTVDFRNTILIMTSNAGSRDIAKGSSLGFGHATGNSSYDVMRSKVMSELKRVFNPEFLNRVDEVIVFNLLGQEHIAKITELMLDEVRELLRDSDVDLVILPDAVDFIVERGYDPHFGARHLRREIQRCVEDPIAEKMLDGSARGNTIYVSRDGDKLVFDTAEPAACVVTEN